MGRKRKGGRAEPGARPASADYLEPLAHPAPDRVAIDHGGLHADYRLGRQHRRPLPQVAICVVALRGSDGLRSRQLATLATASSVPSAA